MQPDTFILGDQVVVSRVVDGTLIKSAGSVVGRSHPINLGWRYDVKISGGVILTDLTSMDFKMQERYVPRVLRMRDAFTTHQ